MRRAVVSAVFGLVVTAGVVSTSAPLGAIPRTGQTTTVSGATTPTTTPPPTTVAPPPTTAAVPTTTPNTNAANTSVVPVTTPASTSSDDSSTPWGVIIAILVVIAAGLIAALIAMKRGANRTKHDWQGSAASALRDAELTQDMLEGEARPDQAEDQARFSAVRDKVNVVAGRFDQLAASAPDDGARRHAVAIAESLRGYFFALEAERLLHDAPTPPSAEQLGTADATRRGRAADLEAAIATMKAAVSPSTR